MAVHWEAIKELMSAEEGGEGGNNNIVVATRVRPFNRREVNERLTHSLNSLAPLSCHLTPLWWQIDLGSHNCVKVIGEGGQQQVWITDPESGPDEPQKFTFDFCFDSFAPGSTGFVSQEAVFEALGLGILAKIWAGYAASIFACKS